MLREHLSLLVCPKTKRNLALESAEFDADGAIKDGWLTEPIAGSRYRIANYIPRFVEGNNYADSFGYQWNIHSSTQHDIYSGSSISRDRFISETKWPQNLEGELVLEAGCGAGRFTTHALATGATVVAFDYSNAIDANYKINGKHKNLLLVQADIYSAPFRVASFDRAFCFGVLQHTPNPEKSFFEIVTFLKPGGRVATDIYWKASRRFLHIKFWVRPLVNRLPPRHLYRLVQGYVNCMWPLVKIMRKSRLGQKAISRFVADRSDLLGKGDEPTLKEWAYLDTFDWLSPRFDYPQTLKTFAAWHRDAGLKDIEVCRGHNGLEGRGTKV